MSSAWGISFLVGRSSGWRRMVTLVFGLLVLSCASARAGVLDSESTPYAVVHRDSDDGMPLGQVFAICQTRDGYMWFGTDEGLGRFDGVRFKVFDSRNTPGFRTSRISVLYEDRSNALWVGTSGSGLMRLKDGEAVAYGRKEGLGNGEIKAIHEDGQGVLWVGTDGGGLYYLENGTFRLFTATDGLSDLFVHSLDADASGSLWVGYRTGLRQLRLGRVLGTWTYEALGLPNLIALTCDPRGGLWLGTKGGLYHFSDGHAEGFSEDRQLRMAERIQVAANGDVWLACVGGLARLRGTNETFFTTSDGLGGNLLNAVFVDREGSVWIGNNGAGVDQLKAVRFANYTTSDGVLHDMVTCLFEDSRSNIWIGSERGITRFSRDGFTQFSTNNGLSHRLVFTVCEDLQGDIWVGTRRGLNRVSGDSVRVYSGKDGFSGSVVWCSYRDRSGTLWFGTRGGVVRVKEGQFRKYNHDNSGLSHEDVRAICEDASGALWVGTSYSLNRLDGERFTVFKEASTGDQFKVVLALLPDADGSVWIGTMDKGLFRHRNGRFDHFTTEQGLFDDRIYQILDDGRGRLWMPCVRGVFSVARTDLEAVAEGRRPTFQSENYGKSDGMLSAECNGTFQPAGLKSHDGRLWFPTVKGAAVINPSAMALNDRPPAVVIEEVLLDGERRPATGPVVVPPGVQRVDFHFTAPTFIAADRVGFRYQLEEFDRNWSTNLESRSAQYTRLPPGHYQFHVTAALRGGDWNSLGATVSLEVKPYYYQTAWFRILGIFFVLGSTAALARAWSYRRHRRELQALERRHALERERTRIAQDMHDGLGSNLVKISLLGEIAEAELETTSSARPHIQKMADTARETVREMDEIVWAVNPKNDTVENFANYLCAFAREHFELTSTRLHLEMPAEFPAEPLPADTRHNLFLAAKEGLNNVVRHANASEAWLRIEMRESMLVLTIRDNGRGLPAEGTSSPGQDGLENIRLRLERIGGRLESISEPGAGTSLILTKHLSGHD